MRFRLLLLSILLSTAFLSVLASAQRSVVYIESNRADHNSVLGFQNNHGTLSLLGEFPTNGKGVFDLSLKLGPFDSDQAVMTNAEGTVLYAVNSGSDSIAAFRVSADGRLSPLLGSPFASGGTNPVSVGISRDTLAVVNKAMDPSRPQLNQPNYTSFSLAPDGSVENGPSQPLPPLLGVRHPRLTYLPENASFSTHNSWVVTCRASWWITMAHSSQRTSKQSMPVPDRNR